MSDDAATLHDVKYLNQRIDDLKGSIDALGERVTRLSMLRISEAQILAFRDGDVLHAHIPGSVSMEQANAAQECLRAEIGDFVEERTGAKIRVIVTTGDLSMSIIRKEEADALPD